MINKRAVYIGDVRYYQCPVFELNNGYYEMLQDKDFRYEEEIVNIDCDWLIFEVDTTEEKAKLIKADYKDKDNG